MSPSTRAPCYYYYYYYFDLHIFLALPWRVWFRFSWTRKSQLIGVIHRFGTCQNRFQKHPENRSSILWSSDFSGSLFTADGRVRNHCGCYEAWTRMGKWPRASEASALFTMITCTTIANPTAITSWRTRSFIAWQTSFKQSQCHPQLNYMKQLNENDQEPDQADESKTSGIKGWSAQRSNPMKPCSRLLGFVIDHLPLIASCN